MTTIVNKRKWLGNVTLFLDKYAASALSMEEEYGLPAVAVLAQLALETGWGKKILKLYPDGSKVKVDSMNLFNIKASRSWTGPTGNRWVWEDFNRDGKRQRNEYIRQRFRMYESYADAFKDYAQLITNAERYEPAVAVANDPIAYVEELQECGYATDAHYGRKILSIMRSNFRVEETWLAKLELPPPEKVNWLTTLIRFIRSIKC